MSDKGGDAQLACHACHGPARGNAKLHMCDNCGKSFHSICVKLAPVTIDNKTGRACQACIVKAILSLKTPRSRTASNSSMSDVADTAGPSNDVLKSILKEIGGLRSSVDTRFDKFEAKLAELDGIGARVTANEVGLEDVRRELAEIKQRLDNRGESPATGSAGTDPELMDKILNLEKRNAELSSRVAKVSTLHLSISTDLVIGGLSVPEGCDLKVLATAILVTVHPDIEARDIVAVRPLISKAMRDKAGSNSASTESTNASQFAANTSTVLRPVRPPPLLITVTSRALLEAIIRGKIKTGKLHTSALAGELPVRIMNISPALININEFLPSEVFKLHRWFRQQAKLPDAGFMTFIRGGHIYVRRKKSDTATLIVSEEDLHRFLAS